MEEYEGVVVVQTLTTVLDPEASAIEKHLKTNMGFPEVKKVYCGKRFVVQFDAESEESAKERMDELAKKLFANLTYQTYKVTVTKKAS